MRASEFLRLAKSDPDAADEHIARLRRIEEAAGRTLRMSCAVRSALICACSTSGASPRC